MADGLVAVQPPLPGPALAVEGAVGDARVLKDQIAAADGQGIGPAQAGHEAVFRGLEIAGTALLELDVVDEKVRMEGQMIPRQGGDMKAAQDVAADGTIGDLAVPGQKRIEIVERRSAAGVEHRLADAEIEPPQRPHLQMVQTDIAVARAPSFQQPGRGIKRGGDEIIAQPAIPPAEGDLVQRTAPGRDQQARIEAGADAEVLPADHDGKTVVLQPNAGALGVGGKALLQDADITGVLVQTVVEEHGVEELQPGFGTPGEFEALAAVVEPCVGRIKDGFTGQRACKGLFEQAVIRNHRDRGLAGLKAPAVEDFVKGAGVHAGGSRTLPPG